jgi:hypothetical protein
MGLLEIPPNYRKETFSVQKTAREAFHEKSFSNGQSAFLKKCKRILPRSRQGRKENPGF